MPSAKARASILTTGKPTGITLIIITWDDWGGWFDHVPPFLLGGESNGWGKSYTYGFRVPLLFVPVNCTVPSVRKVRFCIRMFSKFGLALPVVAS